MHIVYSEDAEKLAGDLVQKAYSEKSATGWYNDFTAAYYQSSDLWYVTAYTNKTAHDQLGVSQQAYGMLFDTDGKLLSIWKGLDQVPAIDYSEEGVYDGPITEYNGISASKASTEQLVHIRALYNMYCRKGGLIGSVQDTYVVKRYYGEFSGALAASVQAKNYDYPNHIFSKVAGGYYFHSLDALGINIFTDSYVYSLDQAYNLGIITQEDIARLAYLHNAQRYRVAG